jgi:hypothetical protein
MLDFEKCRVGIFDHSNSSVVSSQRHGLSGNKMFKLNAAPKGESWEEF